MARRRLPPEERRARLIEAAETVFATEGFGGTRLEDIAREAEVSPGLMSQYWPGGKLASVRCRVPRSRPCCSPGGPLSRWSGFACKALLAR